MELEEAASAIDEALTQADSHAECCALLQTADGHLQEHLRQQNQDKQIQLDGASSHLASLLQSLLQQLKDQLSHQPDEALKHSLRDSMKGGSEGPKLQPPDPSTPHRSASRLEALRRVGEAEEAASRGEHQFLSGLLHNMAKVLTMEPVPASLTSQLQQGQTRESVHHNYLSTMLTYIAQICDNLAAIDPAPGEAHNYFALLDMLPQEVIIRLINQRGLIPTLFRIAELMDLDPIHQLFKAFFLPADHSVECNLDKGKQHNSDNLDQGKTVDASHSKTKTSRSFTKGPVRKARMPGLTTEGSGCPELTVELLKQIIGQAPIHGILFALALLFHRRSALALGPFPLVALDSEEALQAKASEGHAEEISDKQLLDIVMDGTQTRFPVVHRWMKLQLERNHALADLQTGKAGIMGALSEKQKRESIRRHRSSGEWMKALRLAAVADLTSKEMDQLFTAAVNAIAPHAIPVKQGGFKGMPEATQPEMAESLSLQWLLSIADGTALAETCLMHLKAWSGEKASQALSAACCGAPPDSELHALVVASQQRLQIYQQIVQVPELADEYALWQDVDARAQSDPEILISDLISANAANLALDLMTHLNLRPETGTKIRCMAILQQLKGSCNGKGSMSVALRSLLELPPDEVLGASMVIIEQFHDLDKSKLVLNVLERADIEFSTEEKKQLSACQQGLDMLSAMPRIDQRRLQHLVTHPKALFEHLVMSQQFILAATFAEQFPEVVDNDMLADYARKAISFNRWSSSPLASRASTPLQSSGLSTTSPASLHSAAATPIRQQGGVLYAREILTGDSSKDREIRGRHSYRTAPNPIIAQHILQLVSDAETRDRLALTLANGIVDSELSAGDAEDNGKPDSYVDMERRLDACNSCIHLLVQCRNAEIKQETDSLLRRVEICQTLLSRLIPITMEDISTDSQVEQLVERLITSEDYTLAIYLAKQFDLNEAHIWMAWAESLIGLGEYEEAQQRLSNAFKTPISKAGQGDGPIDAQDAQLALQFVDFIRSSQAVSLDGLQQQIWQKESFITWDVGSTLSADEFLQVLHVSEGPASLEDPGLVSQNGGFQTEEAYQLSKKLIRAYQPQDLLRFMFDADKAAAACQLLYPPQQQDTHLSNPSTETGHRFGNKWHLLKFSIQHDELRTLCRVLAAGGAPGRAALLEICNRLQGASNPGESPSPVLQPPEEPSASGSLTEGSRPASTAGGPDTDAACLDAPQSSTASSQPKLTQRQVYMFLLRANLALRLLDRAGLDCLSMCWLAGGVGEAVNYLKDAALHFEDALRLAQASPGNANEVSVPRLSPAKITKLLSQTRLQLQVYEVYQSALNSVTSKTGPDSLLTAPDPLNSVFMIEEAGVLPDKHQAKQAQLQVASQLVVKHFDLAFHVIHSFGVDPVAAYTQAATNLALQGDLPSILQVAKNLKGTSTDQEIDQVLAAGAVNFKLDDKARQDAGWARLGRVLNKQNPVDVLISHLNFPSSQVNVLLQLGKLQEACDLAIKLGKVQAVRLVSAQARRQQDKEILAACQAFLQNA